MNKIWSGEHFLLAKSGFHEKVWSHEHTSTLFLSGAVFYYDGTHFTLSLLFYETKTCP